jgi:hypothetical protein
MATFKIKTTKQYFFNGKEIDFKPKSIFFDKVSRIEANIMLTFKFCNIKPNEKEWVELLSDCVKFGELVSGVSCKPYDCTYHRTLLINVVPTKSVWA